MEMYGFQVNPFIGEFTVKVDLISIRNQIDFDSTTRVPQEGRWPFWFALCELQREARSDFVQFQHAQSLSLPTWPILFTS